VWVVEGSTVAEYRYNEKLGEYRKERSFGSAGSGEVSMKEALGIAIGAEGNLYISDTGNDRVDEWSQLSTGGVKHVRNFGKEGTGAEEFKEPHGIATDSAGDVWVADTGNDRVEELGPTGTYIQAFGKEGTSEGKLKAPEGVAIDSANDAWIADTANSNVQEWTLNGTGYGAGVSTARDTQTIYYTAGANAKVTSCGEHAEWANLPCQTQPAVQPEGSLPKLQVTTYTYNFWDEPETTTNTSGTTTRTTTETYDPAGRLRTTATSSTVGKALSAVTYEYSSETGVVVKQCTNEGKACTEGKPETITSAYNTLGELTSYTDAAEARPATNTTKTGGSRRSTTAKARKPIVTAKQPGS
jgi:NHL repeat